MAWKGSLNNPRSWGLNFQPDTVFVKQRSREAFLLGVGGWWVGGYKMGPFKSPLLLEVGALY